jgi:hypothetical protein
MDIGQELPVLECRHSRASVEISSVVGEFSSLVEAHVHQLMSLLDRLPFSPVFLCVEVHVQLCLLLSIQLWAFVRPMAWRHAVKTVPFSQFLSPLGDGLNIFRPNRFQVCLVRIVQIHRRR